MKWIGCGCECDRLDSFLGEIVDSVEINEMLSRSIPALEVLDVLT